MSPIGNISPLQAGALTRIDAPLPKSPLTPSGPITGSPQDGFGQVLDGLVATVASKQEASQDADARKCCSVNPTSCTRV